MSISINVLRSADLLSLQLEFLNLKIDDSGPRAVLRRAAPGAAHIVLRLPAQHLAERVRSSGSTLDPPFQAVLSGPTRLAFKVPNDMVEIPLTLQDILAFLSSLPPVLSDAPLSPSPASVIEFPFHLLLVPEAKARLQHREDPPSADTQWAELWQTRLSGEAGVLRLKAISYPNDQDVLSPATLTLQDRKDIVARSSTEPKERPVIEADRFVLSALGADVKLRSTWSTPLAATTLSAWTQETVLGRDQQVRTVREGFLFPFGHRAAIETVTSRILSDGAVPVAELRQHTVVALRERDRTYQGRDMPLRRVQLTSVPQLRNGGAGEPEIGPYQVDATMADLAGNAVNCSLAVLFVPIAKARDLAALGQVKARYMAASTDDPLNVVDVGGQRLILAEDPGNRGGTDFNVSTLTIGVTLLGESEAGPSDPLFRPVMDIADVSIPAVEQMKGAVRAARMRAGRPLTPIRLTKAYIEHGINPADAKQVFAEIVEPIDGLEIPADQAGGLASPRFPKFDGLSRLMGPVSDVRNFVDRDEPPLRPEDLIGDTRLLGMIPLKDLVDLSKNSDVGFLAQQPELLFGKVDDPQFILRRPVIATARTGTTLETRFVWKPKIKDVLPGEILKQREPPSGPSDPARPRGDMQLVMRGRMKLAPTAEQADLRIEGRLTNFVLSFGGLVNVEFNQVSFVSTAGRKMDVKTSIAKIGFEGKLAFAEEIRKAIPIGGLGDGSISPQPDGITVSYGLGLPAIGLGVISLQDVVFNSSIALPFVEGPVVIRFALSERSKPFLISVAPFGGTGFFGLELRTGGPSPPLLVEAAIEFGGIIAFNLLGIVKGGVYVLAGVYLAIGSEAGPNISAHLRLGGFVDVLGLISVSIELYLALDFRSGRLAGSARLTIGVKVLFFSKTFSFEVHKEIAHLGGAPRDFRFLADRDQWARYCEAFA